MATNDLTFQQVSTIMNSIYNQVTGTNAPAAVDTSTFVTQAQTVLKTGYDPVIFAISQVLDKTIFSIRPYSRKFKGLTVTNQRWGNHTRKLTTFDGQVEDDKRYPLTEGSAIDHYVINKPDVLQTNFYGENVYQRHITIFKNQLDSAFTGPDELGQFFTMIMQNISDTIEQQNEYMARYTILNLIGGTAAEGEAERVVKLVTLFNTFIGLSGENVKTYAEIKADPELYKQFIRWCFSYINTLSQALTERTALYHTTIPIGTQPNAKIMRHTPVRDQRLYMYQPFVNEIDALVKSDTYNSEFLRLMDFESVNFWQNPTSPTSINITAGYIGALGVSASKAFENPNVVGVLMDREAAGMNIYNTWTAPTPINAAGGYYNIYYHWTTRWWNDLTENSVILLLE